MSRISISDGLEPIGYFQKLGPIYGAIKVKYDRTNPSDRFKKPLKLNMVLILDHFAVAKTCLVLIYFLPDVNLLIIPTCKLGKLLDCSEGLLD